MKETRQYLPSETLRVFGNGLYEIRLLSKSTKSMYTNNLDKLDEKIKAEADRESNFYFTLNELNEALHSREQSEKFVRGSFKNTLKTTSDNDIIAYRWLLIDLDPTRPSGVASSDEEKEAAHILCKKMFKSLLASGVPKNSIIVADSGNGYHLLIRVNFPNNAESIELVRKFLGSLDFLFSTNQVQVDTKNCNPSRVTKLYGTTARKGTSSTERPHRRSNLLLVPENIEICPKEVIETISQIKPELERNNSSSTSSKNFDAESFLNDFIEKHNIACTPKQAPNGMKRFVLDTCPFDSAHGKDSMIGIADNKPFFSCLHNGCRGNHWREFRLLYEPDFEKEREEKQRQYEESKNKPSSSNYSKNYNQKVNVVDVVNDIIKKSDKTKAIEKKQTPLDENKDWYTLVDGLEAINCDDDIEQGFPTGFKTLDTELEGGVLTKGTFTIISGDNSSGKSTFVNQLVLNVANQGHKSMVYSGELVIKRFTKWIMRQACGSKNMKLSKAGNKYVPDYIQAEIAEWAKDKIFLYNNKKSQKVTDILSKIIDCIEKENVELVIVDNLMSMETEELGNDFGVDKQIIKGLMNIAKSYNVHTILIAHPRKSNGYLRKNDISGEKNIANLADNIFIIHRVNDDFSRSYYEYKTGKKWFEGCKTGFEDYGNVLEICKNRDNGKAIDKKIPFYFDVDSSRFLEESGENVVYGWEKDNYMENELRNTEDLPFD